MKNWISKFADHDFIIIATFRYFLGRQTIATVSFARDLATNWHNLPENVQTIISRELDEAFERDDKAREVGDNYKPLGMDCDREGWELVRRNAQNPAQNVRKRKLTRKKVRKEGGQR